MSVKDVVEVGVTEVEVEVEEVFTSPSTVSGESPADSERKRRRCSRQEKLRGTSGECWLLAGSVSAAESSSLSSVSLLFLS